MANKIKTRLDNFWQSSICWWLIQKNANPLVSNVFTIVCNSHLLTYSFVSSKCWNCSKIKILHKLHGIFYFQVLTHILMHAQTLITNLQSLWILYWSNEFNNNHHHHLDITVCCGSKKIMSCSVYFYLAIPHNVFLLLYNLASASQYWLWFYVVYPFLPRLISLYYLSSYILELSLISSFFLWFMNL